MAGQWVSEAQIQHVGQVAQELQAFVAAPALLQRQQIFALDRPAGHRYQEFGQAQFPFA